ncbi:adenosylcobinamide-GDP ribazoletransferase [Azorhizobium oxalatiphilum]|uniref:Adenosylcobinamide-GDP ribazoletransferase n=1 Tax=Azorhizobium oxalatiphilum TaxID=980631 RepID=A0A917BU85_9HYPH|nr:adenosylcobinamide-GDP ribazoletransferase [Azorhizobium oxalatiphilum]GGF57011.1 adenosylcobinamide-GDP ribazoletransferase [Azorhizobium oxalatiphilum]
MMQQRILEDLNAALRFYSRIPLPPPANEPDAFGPPPLARIGYAIPLAGSLIGAIGAVILVATHLLGLPPLVCAALAVTTLVLVTGAFHEDGLADTADGFGGGATRQRKLEIMRDSRVGSYGACALVLSLLLRVALLEGLLAIGPAMAAVALIAAEGLSRSAGILLIEFLPAARMDGASAAAGQPGPKAAGRAGIVGALVAAVLLVPVAGVSAAFAAILAVLLALFVMTRLSRRMIGGQTGDVAGAVQQVAEIAFLLAVLIFARVH